MPAGQWYYLKDNQQVGPVDEQELRRLAAEGELGADDLVWHEGMSDWERAADVADLTPGPAGTATDTQADMNGAVEPAAPRGGGVSGVESAQADAPAFDAGPGESLTGRATAEPSDIELEPMSEATAPSDQVTGEAQAAVLDHTATTGGHQPAVASHHAGEPPQPAVRDPHAGATAARATVLSPPMVLALIVGLIIGAVLFVIMLQPADVLPSVKRNVWMIMSKHRRADAQLPIYFNFEPQHGQTAPRPVVLENVAAGDPNEWARLRIDPGYFDADFPQNAGQHPAWTDGRWRDKAGLSFDGKPHPQGDYLDANSPHDLFTAGRNLSIFVWVKQAAPHAGAIVDGSASDSTGFELHVADNHVHFRAGAQSVRTDAALGDGAWHFIAVVIDQESGFPTMTLFLDGQPRDSVDLTAKVAADNVPLNIARRGRSQDHYFHGTIDELGFYTHALTPQAIQEMHDAGKPGR